MTTALVFAAGSFIGRYIVDELKQRGHEVLGTSRRPGNGSADIACDLTDTACVDDIVRSVRPALIVQCGAATSSRDPRELYATHVGGTLNVLDAVAAHVPAARLLLMGSAAEYGALPDAWLPLTEDRPARPASFFGASKLAQTELAQAAAAERNLRLASVRPFNVIGPRLPEIYFAASLAKRLLSMKRSGVDSTSTFEVTNPQATRDFVDVRDVATAVATLLERDSTEWIAGACEIFNIATGCETTLMQLAEVIGALAGPYIPIPGGSHQSRGGIQRSCGSYEKLHAATGWKPRIDWSQSARDVWIETCRSPKGGNLSVSPASGTVA